MFKKICILVSSIIVCYGFAYSGDGMIQQGWSAAGEQGRSSATDVEMDATSGKASSFLGSYLGSDATHVGMASSNLFASSLLDQKGKFGDYSVTVGGLIEADAQIWFGSSVSGSSVSKQGTTGSFGGNDQGMYLTSSKLYFVSNLGRYVTAEFDFSADQSNSFSLGNAFLMFGNLENSPFFLTAGKSKISLGSYSGGGPLTDGISAFLAPGKVTNVSLNYRSDGVNANVALFGLDGSGVDFSTALFYAGDLSEAISGGFNVGYAFNILGAGNASLSGMDAIDDNVGVINIDANVAYKGSGGVMKLKGGWSAITDKEKFNGSDEAALTGAWYTAIDYSTVLGGKNTDFSISYGQSYNAAAVPMKIAPSPTDSNLSVSGIKHQIIFSAQRAYFDDNVVFGPEYVYQKLYNGQHMNTFTLDMSVYI